jgi:uncharacterized protein YbjQ (UPF0145 family)
MGKLMRDVERLGADGVVGARVLVDHREHHAEFVAMGTAVRARDGGGPWRVRGRPFTSDLSGQDFWALVRGGYRPRAMVVGCCVYHVAHQSLGKWLGTFGNNCEMPNFTQALYDARELAMARMQAEASAAGASGVVGMRLSEGSYGWHSHIIEFLAVGTAVAPSGAPGEHEPIAAILDAGSAGSG